MARPRHPLIEELLRRVRRGMDLGLAPTREALARLGSPERDLAVVHVAGTNGKGSVCAMLEAIAREAGLRTGLYTSPHLCRIAERVRVGGEPIDDETLLASLERALRAGPSLTFFETLTVTGLDALRLARVDLAILEVGLGGRLDATNVVESPLCTAITSIGLDHTELLGETLALVAREKAGIAKTGVPLVLGALPAEARDAVAEAAGAIGAGPLLDSRPWTGALGLAGAHQRDNAGVAASVVGVLAARWPSLAPAVARGLEAVRWPGRLEALETDDGIEVLFDGAHNAEGAQALASALIARGHDPAHGVLLFGTMADKPFGRMLACLAPLAAHRVYTTPGGRAPAALDALVRVAPGETAHDPAGALGRALELARASGPEARVLVTGSLYLVGEVRSKLLGLDCDPIVPL